MTSTPHPIDVHVGGRIRLRRTLLGMSQVKLASALGLTFQQIQKYERGFNRVGSSRLYQLSKILEVPVSFFFEGMSDETATGAAGVADRPQASYDDDTLSRRETLEMVRAYYRITDPAVRKRLNDLMKAIGRQDSGAE
jgi:transcriptional regulator with XRE-family HTH domain